MEYIFKAKNMYIGPLLPSFYVTVEKKIPRNDHEVKIFCIRTPGEPVVVSLVDSLTPRQSELLLCVSL